MIPDFSGDFVNFNSTSDGDILEIIEEGKSEYNDVLKKKMFNMKVKKGEKIMTWSPSNKHGKLLQEAFGMDSINWIGKKVQIIHIEDSMLIKPIVEQKQ